jgi:hypothetical protein
MNKELISIFDAIRNSYHKLINSNNFGFLIKTFLACYGMIAIVMVPFLVIVLLISVVAGIFGFANDMPFEKRDRDFMLDGKLNFLPEPFGKTARNSAVLGISTTQEDTDLDTMPPADSYEGDDTNGFAAPVDDGALPEDYDPTDYYNPQDYQPIPMPIHGVNRIISPNPSPDDFRAPLPPNPFESLVGNTVFLLAFLIMLPIMLFVLSYIGAVNYLAAKSVQTENEVRITQLLRDAKRYMLRFLGLQALLQLLFLLVGLPTLIFVLLGILVGDLGLAFLVFLGILYATCALTFVGVKSMFATYVLFHEDKGAVDSIKESFEMTKGYFWNLLGKGIVYILFSLFVVIPIFFLLGNQYTLGGAGSFLIGMFSILVIYEIYLDLKRLKGEVSTEAAFDSKVEPKIEAPAGDDLK